MTKASTMKPSEAMLVGCQLTLPGRHYLFEIVQTDNDTEMAACAIGAALLGYGLSSIDFSYGGNIPTFIRKPDHNRCHGDEHTAVFTLKRDGQVQEAELLLEAVDAYRNTYGQVLVNDNDRGKFTREGIAKRLQKLGY